MAGITPHTDDELDRLRDEIEQLRVGLEAALDENARLLSDRGGLSRRVIEEAKDVRTANAAYLHAKLPEDGVAAIAVDQRFAPDDGTMDSANEELRVAFEELQVMTEELEVANATLQESNRVLDSRVIERTQELERANTALRASEASLDAITNLVPDLLWRAGPDGAPQWYNDRWRRYTGQTPQQQDTDSWLTSVHPVQRAEVRHAWHNALRERTPFERELRMESADGSYRWFLARAERAANADAVSWFGSFTDVHDQRVAFDALAKAELRLRSLIEGIPQLIWRAARDGGWTWASPQWTAYTGLTEAQSRGKGWLRALHIDDRPAAEHAFAQAALGKPFDIKGRIFHAGEQRHRHFRTRAMPVREENGRIVEWLGTSTDVDDMFALQRQQGVLIAELQHRTRNLMAVVQAVLMRTMRGSKGLEDFGTAILHRFAALSRVQGLLSQRGDAQQVAFDSLLRAELSAHVALDEQGQGEQVTTHGPTKVPLRSATVQTFALALHELATNAAKYGALSTPAGRLAIRWDAVERDGAQWLRVDWHESGMGELPAADAPARGGGYGRELIERALPYQLGARTTYGFAPDGLQCSIEVPLDRER